MGNPSVLFICTANVCRSPMAEALFRAQLKKARPDDWQTWRVESAGTWASDGDPISKNSHLALQRRGIALENHQSRTVTAEMLQGFDLILTMEPGHKEAIQAEFPGVAKRVFLLSEMSGPPVPVSDPYGKSLEDYERTATLLEAMIEKGFDRMMGLIFK